MTSTLVETVAINYEDFTESFLTCHTCLGNYDSLEHTPKLLPCSHTVCRSCLEHIHQLQGSDTTTLRCPICRETIAIPRGGVALFPPSFLINQLLDLMNRQRRDVVPKCSVHPTQELMFCETCDMVFCMDCADGTHSGRGQTAHNVIPFSIAIKRMSEILLYKANQCMQNLNRAIEIVTEEIHKLENSTELCMTSISRATRDLVYMLEERQNELLNAVRVIHAEKTRVLQNQLTNIETEKQRVESECRSDTVPTDVRSITKKINDLNEMLEMSSKLMEPHDNAFIKFDYKHNDAIQQVEKSLQQFGRICVSTTFPALCTVDLCKVTCHLVASVTLTTVDYHGNPQTVGGDPVEVRLVNEKGEPISTVLTDNGNGTYLIQFKVKNSMKHTLSISILNRPVRESPFTFTVTDHINPIMRYGNKGSEEDGFVQPVSVVADEDDILYVLDTCNSRIKVIDSRGHFLRHLDNVGCEHRSATGIALTNRGTLLIVNWRTKYVTECSRQGEIMHQFTCAQFNEPVGIAAGRNGEIIVADNSIKQVLIFDQHGTNVTAFDPQMGSKNCKLIHYVAVGPSDEILVVDGRMRAFSQSGQFLYEIKCPDNAGKGMFTSACFCPNDLLLATYVERGRSMIHIYSISTQQFLYLIDSSEDKISARPGGLTVLSSGLVALADLAANCIRLYHYI